jgi:hypothetical protein
MANKNKIIKFRKNTLSIAKQLFSLQSLFSNSHTVNFSPSRLKWESYIQPTPLSKKYKILLDYKLKDRPNIWVVDPELEKYNDEKIPHRFKDESLCLFRYKYSEWHPSQLIAFTIIPWTSLWLYYYEVWLITGRWIGGGEHPESKTG